MIVKYNKKIRDYKYLISFDLASHNTGICLWNIEKNKPEKTFLMTTKKTENFVYDLYQNLEIFFASLQKDFNIDLKDVFVCKEAMPVQLRGAASTVQTFVALAKSHAVLDLFLQQHDIDVYDYTGIYPITTHSYLKKLLSEENVESVDKNTIKKYVEQEFNLVVKSYDESDAVFLAVTLIQSKWNKDILEEMKEIKKHKKELVMKNAIAECEKKIDFLINLTI